MKRWILMLSLVGAMAATQAISSATDSKEAPKVPMTQCPCGNR